MSKKNNFLLCGLFVWNEEKRSKNSFLWLGSEISGSECSFCESKNITEENGLGTGIDKIRLRSLLERWMTPVEDWDRRMINWETKSSEFKEWFLGPRSKRTVKNKKDVVLYEIAVVPVLILNVLFHIISRTFVLLIAENFTHTWSPHGVFLTNWNLHWHLNYDVNDSLCIENAPTESNEGRY